MKTTVINIVRAAVLFVAIAYSGSAVAQDIDLFLDNLANKNGGSANVIFVIDTAGANNSTMNTTCGGGTTKKLETELCVLKNLFSVPVGTDVPGNNEQLRTIDRLLSRISVGLIVNTPSAAPNKGGYVHYALRPMSDQANRDSFINALKTVQTYNGAPLGLALMEAYLYMAGKKPYAGVDAKVPYDAAAYDAGAGTYVKPGSGCQKSFVIYIGNGGPDSGADNALPTEFPARVGPIPSDILTPFTNTSSQMDEVAKYLYEKVDLDSTTEGQQNITTFAVVANTNSNPELQKPAVAGRELFKSAAYWGSGKTPLIPGSAKYPNYRPSSGGSGPYQEVATDSDLAEALLDNIKKVTAVNSVFAAVSLPVSVNVRGTYINQVYMGVFRPDQKACPYWVGNLKEYALALSSTGYPYLVDAKGVAVENAGSGFVNPSAQSWWTESSSFWSFLSSADLNYGQSGTSDAPDGEVVEKGGAAQWLRTKYASSLAARKVYTCQAINCAKDAKLSDTPFDTSNTNLTAPLFNAADDTEKDEIINWVRGMDNRKDENADGKNTDVRAYLHGDVLHSRPVIINYNRNKDDNDIGVFYGSNDGMLHAIVGGQLTSGTGQGGTEYWAFVPEDFFGQLKRLRNEFPDVLDPSGKPYFVDGSITALADDKDANGKLDSSDNVKLFATMRRGGNFMYALDVTLPDVPKFLWKVDPKSPGYGKLGQTWSAPTTHKINASKSPVIIMGAGYDAAAEDALPQKTVDLGTGIMVIDTETGDLLWQAGKAPSGAKVDLKVTGMDYGFPSDIIAFDRDGDGMVDRAYAVDTGANIWRIDLDDPDPANWKVTLLATLRSSGAQANERKFLYPPDVVLSGGSGGAQPYDAVLVGSGDREKPFDTTVANRFYMIRDTNTGKSVDPAWKPIDESLLYDVTNETSKTIDQTKLDGAKGWFFKLEGIDASGNKNPGEKVVGGSVTLGGTVFFGTNTPTAKKAGVTICNSLGTAQLYKVSFENGLPTDPLLGGSRSTIIPGGGLLPSPVAAVTIINGKPVEAVVVGTHTEQPPGQTLGKRQKTFWHNHRDK